MKKISLLGVLALLLALFASLATAQADDSLTVNLNPTGNSGVSGVAVFTPAGSNTSLSVTFKGFAPNSGHAGHIHLGSCEVQGPVIFPLPSAKADEKGNATVTATIPAPLSQLTNGQYYINYHVFDVPIVGAGISCGNLPRAADSSLLRVAHLAPYAGSVDVYVNRILALKGVSFGTLSPYLALAPGNYAIDVIPAGATLGQVNPLISEAIDLFAGEAHTYAALNFHEDTSLYSYFYRDDLTPAATANAKIKILHASPDAGAVDIAVKGGPVLVSNLNNGESSEYLEVPAGNYNLEIRAAGTEEVLYTIPTLSLQAGRIYTAIAQGLVSGTPAFKVALITDRVPV